MGLSQDFALDSQCFTYLIHALVSLEQPTGTLADEKMALLRSFLYSGGWHFITPTVDREWRQISNQGRRDLHESWNTVHFGTVPFYLPEQEAQANARAEELFRYHPGHNDCLILAEAEILGACRLLSFDQAFVKNLTSKARIELIYPSDHWRSMRIASGTSPKVVPHPSNPLSRVSWWRV